MQNFLDTHCFTKKQLRRIAIASLLFQLTAGIHARAQATPAASAIQATDMLAVEALKDTYSKRLDSLLLEDRYRNIIEIGELLTMDREPEISRLPIPYLIAAYHFIGNTNRSKKLLQDTMARLDYEGLVQLLTTSNIAFIKYFNEPGNREPIITMAIHGYKKTVKATDKEAGEQLIKFYINDQVYRKLKYAYKEDDQVSQAKRFELFKLQDSIQNANVYAFYKRHNKYFNAAEVGRSVSWYQPLILSHYDNIHLRQTFFKDLLEKAVREGRMEKTNYVHFLLRTESFVDPDFFKNLEKRMEQVRKEYDLPEYLWNPF